MPAKKKKSGRGGLMFSLVLIAILLFGLFKIFGPNTGSFTQGQYLYIRTGANYNQVKQALTAGGFISDMWSFDLLANAAKLPARVHPGKYKIKQGMSNYNMVRMLRSGRQTPVKLVINKLRTKHDLITLIANNLEADSVTLSKLLQDPVYLAQFGVDTNTALCIFMPDSYEFYWNTTSDKTIRKIAQNYQRFWDDERKAQARAHNLTQTQVVTIASIVDEETNLNDDKLNIASVYINRLRIGMKLQADPTVKYAVGDFNIRRIQGTMLSNQSPYNTYVHEGLPPGPICTPAPSSIKAVLAAPKTTYLYFCADADLSGRSSFASTFDEQLKNARAYQKALDARGIK